MATVAVWQQQGGAPVSSVSYPSEAKPNTNRKLLFTFGLLCLHLLVLALAAAGIWGVPGAPAFNHYTYSYQNGWGYPYISDYKSQQTFAYGIAYALGVLAYGAIRRQGMRSGWTMIGMILCFLGGASFTLELSHLLWNHHLSYIVSAPTLSLLLGLITLALATFQQRRQSSPDTEPIY